MDELVQQGRSIDVVTTEILQLQSQARRIALSMAIEFGRRFHEAKAMLEHGAWTPWLESVGFSPRTAQSYMQIFTEYGGQQLDLFGTPKAQAFAGLSVAQAIKLLAVPAQEREDFARDVDAENLSVRELEQAIRERDELQSSLRTAQNRLDGAELKLKAVQDARDLAQAELTQARQQVAELESRPVEVAVEVDQEAIDAAYAEGVSYAAQHAEDELKTAAKQAKQADKRAKAAEAELEKAKAEAETARAELEQAKAETETARAGNAGELARAQQEADELRRKLAAADGDTAAFKVHFEAVKESFGKLRRVLEAVEARDAERGAKLRAAAKQLAEAVAGQL